MDAIEDDDKLYVLSKAWTGRYTLFYERLKVVINEPDHVLNQIMKFINIDNLANIVNDPQKLKLSPELLDRIFDEFIFAVLVGGKLSTGKK